MLRDTGGHAPISFVVRLWVEHRDPAAAPEWRFQVRHVQSGEEMHCRQLEDVVAFVERRAGRAGPRLSAVSDRDG